MAFFSKRVHTGLINFFALNFYISLYVTCCDVSKYRAERMTYANPSIDSSTNAEKCERPMLIHPNGKAKEKFILFPQLSHWHCHSKNKDVRESDFTQPNDDLRQMSPNILIFIAKFPSQTTNFIHFSHLFFFLCRNAKINDVNH